MFDHDTDYPRLVLTKGAHMATYAEDMGGTVIRITDIYVDKQGNRDIGTVVLSRKDLQELLKWLDRDRTKEHRHHMRQNIKLAGREQVP